MFRAFQCQRLGQPDDGMLGHDIGRLVGRGDKSVCRGHVDHPPPAACLHAPKGRTAQVPGGRHVDRHDLVVPIDREFLDRGDSLDAGVVHDDVDLPEPGRGRGHQIGNLRRVGHVGAVEGHGRTRLGLDRAAVRLDLRGVAKAVHHHRMTGFGQRAGHGKPDPRGGAGHDCGPEVGGGPGVRHGNLRQGSFRERHRERSGRHRWRHGYLRR